jgi:hypothetical protein
VPLLLWALQARREAGVRYFLHRTRRFPQVLRAKPLPRRALPRAAEALQQAQAWVPEQAHVREREPVQVPELRALEPVQAQAWQQQVRALALQALQLRVRPVQVPVLLDEPPGLALLRQVLQQGLHRDDLSVLAQEPRPVEAPWPEADRR